MICTFGSKETRKIWNGEIIRNMPVELQHVIRRKLRMINNSQNMADLLIPPSNRLEKLSGDLNGYFSIRINQKWRIIFKWENNNAFDVEIIDYH